MRSASLLSCFDPRRRTRRRRTVTMGFVTAAAAAAAFVLLAAWSGASLWYFMSRDEIALRLLERQTTLKRDYETRIAALRGQIEKASGVGSAERDRIEAGLRDLVARQQAFEARESLVRKLADRAGFEGAETAAAGSAESVSVTGPAGPARAYAPAPPPASLPEMFQLRLRRPDAAPPPDRTSEIRTFEEGLGRAATTLASLETKQLRLLADVLQRAEIRGTELRTAIRRIGLDPQAVAPLAKQNTGGPLVPVATPIKNETEMFALLAAQAELSIGRLDHLRRSVAALPFGDPIDGEIDLSSGFGYRIDPFTRSPALHTGLDFKAEYGSLVRAAGAGKVAAAEYSGAYGNMIEIEHGFGVSTRYAHLSAIGVSVGQTVAAGAILGRVGTTGRTTGPHLHYETRLSGEPVNPSRFLKAGVSVAAAIPISQ
jgi:murein DD-endopeptidase MepM/ murein hydrolase activator NlpD